MREVFERAIFTIFVLATVVFAISGCGGGANTVSSGNASPSAANSNATAQNSSPASPDNSQFPPLNSEVASLDLENEDGTTFKLSDEKGKVVLVNLWGIWCGPCKQEMPYLKKMQEDLGRMGFEVVGLNVGDEDMQPEDFKNITAFKDKMGLNYKIARINRDGVAKIQRKVSGNFEGVPQSFLIDREGRLRGIFLGGGSDVIGKMRETVEKVVASSPQS